MLTKTFNTETRDELVDIAQGLAHATPSSMLLNKNGKPIIIQIEGCPDAGKSLFWDEYKDALLDSSEMIESWRPEKLSPDEFRYPELWEGAYQGERLKILFFNSNL